MEKEKQVYTDYTCKCHRDMRMQHILPAWVNKYSAETYVGNWYEETVRNTLDGRDHCMKTDCGDLSVQKKQTMVDMLLKPVQLTQHSDGYLHYGDQVQIVCLGPTCKIATEKYPFKRNYCKLGHLALSATVTPEAHEYANAPFLNTDSLTTASPLLYPVVRNSFIIERPGDPCDTTSIVNYGEVFRIRAFKTQYFPLYLFSSPAIRLHAGAKYSGLPKVRFSDVLTQDTLWCAHPLDPMLKLRMELGVPIKLKTRLYIKHNGSGNNLSIEPNFPVPTTFGDELEVTVNTKYDTVRRVSFENIWYFDTERGLPISTDYCDKEFEDQAKYSAKINAHIVDKSASDEAKAEAAGNEDTNEEDDECQDNRQPEQQPTREELEEAQKMMENMWVSSQDGMNPYDIRTAPQPHAFDYTVTRNLMGDQTFPNKKWCCGDTNCCGPSGKNSPQPPKCTPCECVEPPPPGESPNAPIPFHRLLM